MGIQYFIFQAILGIGILIAAAYLARKLLFKIKEQNIQEAQEKKQKGLDMSGIPKSPAEKDMWEELLSVFQRLYSHLDWEVDSSTYEFVGHYNLERLYNNLLSNFDDARFVNRRVVNNEEKQIRIDLVKAGKHLVLIADCEMLMASAFTEKSVADNADYIVDGSLLTATKLGFAIPLNGYEQKRKDLIGIIEKSKMEKVTNNRDQFITLIDESGATYPENNARKSLPILPIRLKIHNEEEFVCMAKDALNIIYPMMKSGGNVIISGNTGTGKTALANLLGAELSNKLDRDLVVCPANHINKLSEVLRKEDPYGIRRDAVVIVDDAKDLLKPGHDELKGILSGINQDAQRLTFILISKDLKEADPEFLRQGRIDAFVTTIPLSEPAAKNYSSVVQNQIGEGYRFDETSLKEVLENETKYSPKKEAAVNEIYGSVRAIDLQLSIRRAKEEMESFIKAGKFVHEPSPAKKEVDKEEEKSPPLRRKKFIL